jgi:hypothetical protein
MIAPTEQIWNSKISNPKSLMGTLQTMGWETKVADGLLQNK